MLRFTVKGKPFGKVNMRPMTIGKHSRMFNPSVNVQYMTQVIEEISYALEGQIGFKKFNKETPVAITILAYYPIPKSCYKFYKRENVTRLTKEGEKMLRGEILPTKKPDLDNISKIICDAITHHGEIWDDDSQIVCSYLSKQYSEKPRVEVIVEEWKVNKYAE
jgi:Holliday junction resolvase RusA-like endonuclease